jgi:two-component system, LytTR family, response regulator
MTLRKYTCYVLDDLEQTIERFIRQTPGLLLQGSNENPIQALSEIENAPPDILFADINMPGLSGIEVAQRIKLLPTQVIFSTAYIDYALDAIKLYAVDYLVKPVNYDDFIRATERAINLLQLKKPAGDKSIAAGASITVICKGAEVEVELNRIYLLEANNNYVNIHLEDTIIKATITLTELEKKLPRQYFLQVHRSFIAAVRHVHKLEGLQILLNNGTKVPVSRSYLELIKERFS